MCAVAVAVNTCPDAEGDEVSSCAFCSIVAGREPATVLRRWPHAVAIVPRRPVVTGHLLVLSICHRPHVAADPAVSGEVVVAAAAELAAAYPHCNVITSRGEYATQTIEHLHLHVVPLERW